MALRILFPLGLVAAALCLLSQPCLAQGGDIISRGGFTPPVKGGGEKGLAKPKEPPPPALPGAQSRRGEAAPAAPGALDLPPTEALFDAINRGDLNGAKDALSRGAELGGRNVLGMSPLELSVDLGRNDITFLLLSMRGGQSPADRAKLAASPPPPSKHVADASPKAPKRRPGKERPVPAAEASVTALSPTRYARSDPGIAVPQAGFLGFGGAAGP